MVKTCLTVTTVTLESAAVCERGQCRDTRTEKPIDQRSVNLAATGHKCVRGRGGSIAKDHHWGLDRLLNMERSPSSEGVLGDLTLSPLEAFLLGAVQSASGLPYSMASTRIFVGLGLGLELTRSAPLKGSRKKILPDEELVSRFVLTEAVVGAVATCGDVVESLGSHESARPEGWISIMVTLPSSKVDLAPGEADPNASAFSETSSWTVSIPRPLKLALRLTFSRMRFLSSYPASCGVASTRRISGTGETLSGEDDRIDILIMGSLGKETFFDGPRTSELGSTVLARLEAEESLR